MPARSGGVHINRAVHISTLSMSVPALSSSVSKGCPCVPTDHVERPGEQRPCPAPMLDTSPLHTCTVNCTVPLSTMPYDNFVADPSTLASPSHRLENRTPSDWPELKLGSFRWQGCGFYFRQISAHLGAERGTAPDSYRTHCDAERGVLL